MAKLELNKAEQPKFSQFLTTSVVAVTVAKTRKFYLHSGLLIAESDRFDNALTGPYKEAEDEAIDLEDEDPELFGFFVEYLYRDSTILSRDIQHYSNYETLALLYAIGERLQAPKFRAYCCWRFAQPLIHNTIIPDATVCNLLRIACTEITERVIEDPMRAHIFWYAAARIAHLQKSDMFRQLLCDIPDLGRHLCLWIGQSQPAKQNAPQYQRFAPESEYPLQRSTGATTKTELSRS